MKNQDTYSNTQRTSGTGTSGTPYSFDANAEDRYWSNAYSSEPYYNKQYGYDDYSPAYKLGYEGRGRYAGRTYNDVESELRSDWEGTKGTSRLAWEDAKHATHDSWQRLSDTIERAMPGDADNDGR